MSGTECPTCGQPLFEPDGITYAVRSSDAGFTITAVRGKHAGWAAGTVMTEVKHRAKQRLRLAEEIAAEEMADKS